MASEWRPGETLKLITAKLEEIAPDNEAMIPVALSLEQGHWHVDIMIKKKHCEYDVHAEDCDIRQALKGAWMRLANYQILERQCPRS